MKRTISLLLAICMSVICVFTFVGCGEEKYVDRSKAAIRNTFDDPEFAKAQEAKDDAAGREHIEIPEDAETITIDGEQYIPIDDIDEIRPEDYDKNFILKHDIDVSGGKGGVAPSFILSMTSTNPDKPFTGKFNGNNYKVYGDRSKILFGHIKDAEISNIIFSSETNNIDKTLRGATLLCGVAENSVIKNIVNYSMLGCKDLRATSGMILYLYKSTVDNIVNYGDIAEGSACIIKYMFDSVAKNCKNYGNISYQFQYPIGGVVSEILAHHIPVMTSNHEATATTGSLVENCENYGNIVGTSYVGGIVGRVTMYNDAYTLGLVHGEMFYNYFTDISRVRLLSNPTVIKNCTNYGNIYRDKEYEEDPLKLTVLCCLGGIVGLGNEIENCTNNGNIYGFETVNPGYTVDYIGGITGAAVTVKECASSVKLSVAKKVKHTDELCGYLIER